MSKCAITCGDPLPYDNLVIDPLPYEVLFMHHLNPLMTHFIYRHATKESKLSTLQLGTVPYPFPCFYRTLCSTIILLYLLYSLVLQKCHIAFRRNFLRLGTVYTINLACPCALKSLRYRAHPCLLMSTIGGCGGIPDRSQDLVRRVYLSTVHGTRGSIGVGMDYHYLVHSVFGLRS